MFTIAPLSNTPLTCTTLPLGPFSVILCTKSTSGNGLILNLYGSSDPMVYRSMACNSVEGLYNSVSNAVQVHTAESKFVSLSGNSTLMGTFSSCYSTLAVQVV